MSFCRITGKSRGLPKPNYFPLLPPISPADAKRLCRITNKSQGLPSHHYVPALSSAITARAHCKVTGKAKGQGPHHYPNVGVSKPHTLIPDYRYVFPKFDEDEKNQKNLLNLMSRKVGPGDSEVRYVYSVEEKMTNLVIPAGLEAAVRDGEVRDVMLDNEGDTILIKMYQGPSMTVGVKDFIPEEGTVMWEGLGPSEAVLLQREKEGRENEERKAKRLEAIKARKKVFEDKEKAFDEEELEMSNRQEMKKAKLSKRESLKENHLGGFTTFNEKLFSSLSNDKKEPVFGHIVHTSSSVTFFPGTSVVDLPEGKIIPGRMVQHNDGIKFVPGIMLDGDFIPGQMVVTNNGEEFVPGQVIETCEGPKFVPGQVAETSSGPKFVPGQTIETENGPQFVPGQIIETRAGPTFIPGQIIVTDNQAKFVPGRVIETAEGPRFVPGRVIETGDQVIFVSGQVVETPDGLKFIAPDLESSNDGAQEFSVQGFEVTPEELKLLRPKTTHATSECVAAVDSNVLKQLASAGMSIGRQISTELPKVDVRALPVTSERLKLTGEHAAKMVQVVVNLVRLAFKVSRDDESCTSRVEIKEDVGVELMRAVEQNKDLEKYVRVIVASAVIACRHKKSLNEETLMTAVSLAIESTLGEAVAEVSADTVIDILHSFLRSPENFNQIILETVNYLEKRETVKDRIEFALDESSEPDKVIKKLSKTLEGTLGESFRELLSKDDSFLPVVLEQLKNLKDNSVETAAEETVQNAIISAVKEKSRQTLREMMAGSGTKNQSEIKDFQNLLQQSVALAKALGMYKVAATLTEVISDSKSHELLSNDPTVMNILQRLTVMRQIAEVKPEFAAALKKLTTNPEAARSDPSMRELMRRSTALLVAPKKDLQSSADIPLSLVMSSNPLAMEEYLIETKRPRTLLILKNGLQAVVPREAARAVLTGQVPYAVVDEKGIKYFEPLHVFSTMKLPKYAARCFSMYCCPEVNLGENTPINSTIPRGRVAKAKDFKIVKRSNDSSYNIRRVVESIKTGDDNSKVEVMSEEKNSSADTKRLKLDFGGETIDLLDNPAAKHKLSIRPKKKHGDPRQRTISSVSDTYRCLTNEDASQGGRAFSNLRNQSNSDDGDKLFDSRCKREAVVKELLETEEEFGRDLTYVVDHYLKPSILDGSSVPRVVRDNTDIIFSNFQQITNFHNTTLLEGIKYYSDEPRMLGKTFLRLERDFDKHIAYCRDEPLAQDFLAETPQVTEFFEELSQKLGDGKSISEYLKLPVQRINDYQVLLKDLVKYSDKLGENTYDLQRALDLMLAIPQRANDNKFLSNIEGFHGNIHKLGRLLKHDWFSVFSEDKTSKERYLFLFKNHVIVCKVKKISEDRSVFILKDLITLSDIKIRDCPDEKTFEILRRDPVAEDDRLRIVARKSNSKDYWLSEIRKHVPEAFIIEKKIAEDGNSKLPTELEETKERVDSHTVVLNKDSKQVLNEKSSELENNNLYKENSEETDAMSRRYSTRKSYKAYEESYSVSSQREVYSHSSSATATSRFSSTSLYDSRIESSNYESSTKAASTRAITGRSGSLRGTTKPSITSADKPVFTRTITGLNLEPGDTAVFECHLDCEAQLTWLKDNKALDDKLADRVVRSSSDDGTHRLELQHVTELDSGIYTAMAQNDNGYATCTAQLLVHKISDEERQRRIETSAPIFTVRLKDTELLTNTNFRFMVKVKGNPNPDVRFYKDSIAIRRGDDHIKLVNEKADIGFYELVISDVQPNHAGVYSCKASNEYGEAHCEGTITVTDHKTVFKGLENEILLTPGEKPTFTWVKDGKPFDPDERFKVLLGNEDDSLALIFQHVRPEDAGLYTCVASTTTGRISCSAELSVQGSVMPLSREPEKPKITNEQKTCEATIGGSAMLEAKILGFPKPDVKWYHEGEEIQASGRFKFLYEDRETMTLVIKNVNPRDGGSYKIMAKNELGEACTELCLTVKEAPKITKKMEDVHVKAEEIITITVGVEGSPTPDIKWYKDGKELKENEKIKFVKETSDRHSLVIKTASVADTGSYSVVASNEINQCSDFCQVKVHSAPEIVKKMEKSVEVTEGEEIVFEIKISSDSSPTVKWLKNGTEIRSDERKTKISVEGDVHTLRIFDSDSKDSGEYIVEITNEYGVTSDQGVATVNTKTYAPTFKKALKDAIAKEGDTNVEFSVEISAYPKPKIRWYLGDMEISEKRTEYAKVEKDDNYKLILKKVTAELKGNYTCRVENDCGSAETTARLTVHSKPLFVKQLQPKITVEEGAELTLQIECSGCPEPEVTWFKDGQEVRTDAHIKIMRDLHRSESYSMTLTLIQGSDGGEYEAKASNCMGSATTKTYVEVFSRVTETTQEKVVKAVKQEPLETSQQAAVTEEEGAEDKPAVLEPTKTKISFHEADWGGFKVEELDNSYAEEKSNGQFLSQGIVEEALDSENLSDHCFHRLNINRGVSIVSLSEDDRTLSRNNSAIDLENFDKKDFEKLDEDEETSETGKRAEDKLRRGKGAADQSDLRASPAAEVTATHEHSSENQSKPEKDFWASLADEKPTKGTFRTEEGDCKTTPKTGNEAKTNSAEEISHVPSQTELNGTPPNKRLEPTKGNNNEPKTDDFWASLANTPKFDKETTESSRAKTVELDNKILPGTASSPLEEGIRPLNAEKTFASTDHDLPNDGEKLVEGDLKTLSITTSDLTFKQPDEDDFWASLASSNDEKVVRETSLAKDEGKAAESDYKASPAANARTQLSQVPSEKNLQMAGKDLGTSPAEEKKSQATELEKDDFWETLTDEKKPNVASNLTSNKTEEGDLRTSPLAPAETAINKNDSSLDESKKFEKKALNERKVEMFEAPPQKPDVRKLEKLDEILTPKENGDIRTGKDPKKVPEPSQHTENESDGEDDPEVKALLSRIKKQRSVLEEILTKEAESRKEDTELKQKPTFRLPLKDQKCSREEVATFKCVIAASLEPEITWLHDDKEIKVDGLKIKTEASVQEMDEKATEYTYILKITEPEVADAGLYMIKANNKYGFDESSATLTIQIKDEEKPNIKSLKDVSVNADEDAVFEAEVISTLKLLITWIDKNGDKIKGGDRVVITEENTRGIYRMTIKSTQVEDAGEYTLIASNDNGDTSQKVKLSVHETSVQQSPIFKVPLKDQKCSKNDVATFKCVVASNSEPEITWHLNGKQVKIDGIKIKSDSSVKEASGGVAEYTYTLKISEPESADAGLYMAKAKNKYGYDESSASLTILIEEDTRPQIKNLKDVTVVPDEDATFEAEVISKLEVVVKWLDKNSEVIQADDHVVLSHDKIKGIYKLTVKNAKATDAGEFTLVASNGSGERTQSAKLFVTGERPTIVKPVEDTRVKDGTDVDFLIRCNGIPKPEVEWFKDGKKLCAGERISIKTQSEGQVSSSLSIEKFGVADEGQYKVVATNMVGSAENSFALKLAQLPPVLERGLPRSEEVDEGELLELKCKLTGSPIPQVTWLKDGVPLPTSDRVKVMEQPDGLVKLSIENMKPSDSGTYTLKAENPNGQITAICAVAVQPKNCKPKFVDGMKDTEAEVGQLLKLEAKVTCFPPPEVKWFKDGKPLRPSQTTVQSFNEDDGAIELVIKSVKPEDAGLYFVKVSNKLGEVTQEVKVDVIKPSEKPKFEANMMPVSVVEGFPARFDVKSTGNPKPIIKWFHNGKEIVPDGQHIIVKEEPDGTVSLIIDKATPEDAGEYAAKAINDQGEASSKANLSVLGKKTEKGEIEPSFIRPLNNVAIQEDDKLILTAPIAGNPIPEVTWFKDGKPLLSDDRVLLTCDGKKVNLEIKNCKPSDSAVYTCHLKNPLGEDKSKANVDVKKVFTEPVFVEKFKDAEQAQGKDMKFMARITGNPKPEAEWFFNGEPITEGNKYQIRCEGDQYSLLVNNCTPSDSGLYRCSAFNRAGRADCVAQLSVVQKIETKQRAEPPCFLKKISDCDLYKGMTAKFTACCTGFPEPEFEWFRGEEKLKPSNRIKMEAQENGLIRLTIVGVDDEDIGSYRLRIFNSHGEAECSGRLSCDVLEPRTKKAVADREERREKIPSGVPLPLSDKPIISRMTDRHLTLSWKPYIPPGPGAPVTYIVEMCKQPDGDWFTVRRGIRSCACDVRNLEPFQDYKFRVRVENKYGVSDPSPFAVTYRQKIIPEPPKFVPYLSPGIDFRPETSPYFPKDFDLERPPHDRYEQAPKFLRQEHEVQYGIKNQNSNLFWFVYGYPKPTMTYYFNDEPIEMGGRYESSYTRNGQATLFINRMLDRDVGVYEAVARNEHGEARQRVRLEIAEHPTFLKRPEESYIMLRGSGELTARIVGVPYPEIKWYKDWQPLAPSSRIKMQQIAADTVTLTINDAIMKDEGLYSVSATNVAGSVSSSVMVHIEEQEESYKHATYYGGLNVKPRGEPHSNYYDIGDELGRGTQGITYHAVERQTGQNYAAKFMHGRSELKPFMLNELNVMNSLNHRKLIRLHDSFETKDLLVLVMELAGGGELLEWLTKQTYITEYEIADYIRQILWGLEYMHSSGYAHLSLTLNDLLISRPDGDDLKICDFGLSRRITQGNLLALNYGMPEFVAPEVAKGEGVSYSADMWSLGIITYILLSGFSPFKGLNDRETLMRIKEGTWKFDDYFSSISSEAKDFISRLLIYKPEERMDVKAALRHPWLERAGQSPPDQYKISTDILRSYYSSLKNWYKNANCRTWYRRQPLENAFTHPSKMVYPPAHDYTPEIETVAVRSTKQLNGRLAGDFAVPAREPLDYEVGNFKSESHYQYGPDTYLLQLRDVDLPCRLRHYMKVAANREQSYYSEPPEKHLDWRTPVIRERRKFTDVMDEEIDDERRARISEYGSDDIYSLRRLKHEISCRSDGHAEAEAMLEYKREGHIPFFREKPQNLAILQNQPAELSCLVVGDPEPVVQWFKNDLVMAESSRIKMRTDVNKRYYLKFDPALQVDVGAYKVVARNRVGQTVARIRVVLATVPLSPDPPELVEASDTEVLLKWRQECDDVFTPVLCYSLQYRHSESDEWITACKHIDQEFWLVKNLQPSTSYEFRLSSKNCAGWSAPGLPSAVIKTKESGSVRVNLSDTQRVLQSQAEARSEDDLPAESKRPRLDYSIEEAPLEWTADSSVEAKYNFTSEIFRGQFSMVVKGLDKCSNEQIVAKFCEVNANTEKSVAQEFEHFRSLRHERIVTLLAALRPAPNIAILVMEKLQGADVLSYFASRQEYNEDMLVTVFTQVLDGLQYLHWRGYCHLDVQPDNIVLASVKSLHVKLVDFGSAQKVSKLGTVVSGPVTEYTAPEILNSEPAFPQTDIWSLGTLMYVLLSGVSPFKVDTQEETKQNITFVRYRFEHLYKEITQEAQRFLMQIFKRTPSKRPTVEECYEARWFLSSEFMIKKRMKAAFPGSRLKEYSDAYHNAKCGKGLALGELAKAFGEKVLRKSNSVQEELITF